MTITIKDETSSGKVINEVTLKFLEKETTVGEIITNRVTHEVESYNQKIPEYFNGLIEPSEAEKTVNGYKLKDRKKIDAEKQVYVALDAFQKNGYFVLIDNIQVERLDQRIELSENTKVSFLKLTPLVGG